MCELNQTWMSPSSNAIHIVNVLLDNFEIIFFKAFEAYGKFEISL